MRESGADVSGGDSAGHHSQVGGDEAVEKVGAVDTVGLLDLHRPDTDLRAVDHAVHAHKRGDTSPYRREPFGVQG